VDAEVIARCGQKILAPVVSEFTMWVVDEARRMGVSTLYFLSRDGYIPYLIAQKLCAQHGYGIACRYLYCSRKSLHLPVYQFMGEEAFEHIFTISTQCTLGAILQRINASKEQRDAILQELGLKQGDLTRLLQPDEVEELRKKAQNNSLFCNVLRENSQKAYEATMGYLKQEKLFEQSLVAVVDSGWAGTSQRALYRLLKTAGCSAKVQGLYFGLFSDFPEKEDFAAKAWYFDGHRKFWNKVLFSPNLFECMMSAPDGMTVGYTCTEGKYLPQKRDVSRTEQFSAKEAQLHAVMEGFEVQQKRGISPSAAQWRLKRLMAFPTREEAQAYGAYAFSDDVADENALHLCAAEDAAAIRKHTFFAKVRAKLSRAESERRPYWVFGAVSLVDGRLKRIWLRMNVIGLEVFRWIRSR